jgi:hypothetical protein
VVGELLGDRSRLRAMSEAKSIMRGSQGA